MKCVFSMPLAKPRGIAKIALVSEEMYRLYYWHTEQNLSELLAFLMYLATIANEE